MDKGRGLEWEDQAGMGKGKRDKTGNTRRVTWI